MFFAGTIEQHVPSVFADALPYLVTIAAIFSVVYSLRAIHGVFLGPPPTDLPRQPPRLPSRMLAPAAPLAPACLLAGIFPGRTTGPSLDATVRAELGADAPADRPQGGPG